MANVFIHVTMSLDGLIATPNDDIQGLKAGFVDELVIHLCPLLLNDGIRLFEHLGTGSIELERTEIVSTAGITSLRFRVVT